jgi:hypothetical protein
MVSNHFVASIKGPEKTGPPEYTIGFIILSVFATDLTSYPLGT